MNVFTMENVSKSYTDKLLLDHVNLGIQDKDRIGVLGINGTGKSTLLKIMAGLEEADEGTITTGKAVEVVYLPQTPAFNEGISILENIILGKKAKESYRNIEGEARAMLAKLGIANCEELPIHLSGGQKKRAALVRTLLTPADILVLDEPTNHLDSQMAEWLEEYLRKYQGALVMVTHDRYFLDKVTNRIVELDKGKLYSYEANYSKFIEMKALREEMAQATERKNKSLYRVELEWMKRGAKARSTKQKAHIQRFEELRDREKPITDEKVEITSLSSRLGKTTIELGSISKSFGDKNLISDFTYIFLPGDRIGIIGENGCGKSTLLKIITGVIPPDSGTVTVGQTVRIGYFSQENEYMAEEERVIDYICGVAEYIKTDEGMVTASQMLERFLFTGALQYSLIQKLSGGEKRRLYLLRILMEAPNILILDEPTNDLDITTLAILEEYLQAFKGIVIAVSHDRYFLDKLANRIFSFEGNGIIKQYEGNFTDYKDKAGEKKKELTEKEPSKQDWKVKNTDKPKFTYQEKREYDTIENEVAELEDKISRIDQEMENSATDYGKLNRLVKEKEETERLLEEKMERWVYLNDLAEKIIAAGGRVS